MSREPRRSAGIRAGALATGLLLLLVTIIPTSALASGDDGDVMKTTIWQAINLVILLGVLIWASRKPVVQFMSERREAIQNDLSSSAELLSEAERRNSELQRKLVDIEGELEDIRETSRRRVEEEAERILAEANAAAERIRKDAQIAAAQEMRRAQHELREEAADLALDLAGTILREQASDADRERLMDEFITRVEPAGRES